ncbi:MAG: hypothetical protein ACO4CG_15550, partial [Prochlorothrix sp.]
MAQPVAGASGWPIKLRRVTAGSANARSDILIIKKNWSGCGKTSPKDRRPWQNQGWVGGGP